jgi:hypothetical protein
VLVGDLFACLHHFVKTGFFAPNQHRSLTVPGLLYGRIQRMPLYLAFAHDNQVNFHRKHANDVQGGKNLRNQIPHIAPLFHFERTGLPQKDELIESDKDGELLTASDWRAVCNIRRVRGKHTTPDSSPFIRITSAWHPSVEQAIDGVFDELVRMRNFVPPPGTHKAPTRRLLSTDATLRLATATYLRCKFLV